MFISNSSFNLHGMTVMFFEDNFISIFHYTFCLVFSQSYEPLTNTVILVLSRQKKEADSEASEYRYGMKQTCPPRCKLISNGLKTGMPVMLLLLLCKKTIIIIPRINRCALFLFLHPL